MDDRAPPSARASRKPDTRPLTPATIRSLKPGLHADRGAERVRGLYLRVREGGAKYWVFRAMMNGKRRDMGLGGLDELALVQARERASDLRRRRNDPVDPIEARKAERQAGRLRAATEGMTFKKVALAVHETLAPGWKNSKHGDQWINTLTTYAFAKVGDKPVGDVGVSDVLDILRPIWTKKHETARRVRQRIDAVMRHAVAHGLATTNPVDAAVDLLPKVKKQVDHHGAMPYADVPALMKTLGAMSPAAGTLALLFTILTAGRSGEVRGATWDEIDTTAAIWAVPASRMKGGRQHRVPLSGAALDVLGKARDKFGADGLIFKSTREGVPLSDMTLAAVLKRQKLNNVTVHGFRSSFRDWCAENGVRQETAERALAHAVKDSTEAAYHRSDQFEQRRSVMQAWADFLDGDVGAAKVVPIAGARA